LKPGWSTGGWAAVSGPAPTMARRKTPPNPSVPDALSEYQGQRRGGAASKCRARRIGDLRSKLWSIPSPAPFTDAVGPSGSGHTAVPGDDPVRRHPRNAREPPGRGSPFSLSARAERIRSSPRVPAAQGGHGWPLLSADAAFGCRAYPFARGARAARSHSVRCATVVSPPRGGRCPHRAPAAAGSRLPCNAHSSSPEIQRGATQPEPAEGGPTHAERLAIRGEPQIRTFQCAIPS
jgi:hypothetical protein